MAAFSASRFVCHAMLATSAAIFCRVAVTSCRPSIFCSICCLLAAAPASMSSSERNSFSLAANASTMLSPLRAAPDASSAWPSRVTMPEKRSTSATTAVSIWSRDASMCEVHTSAPSVQNACRLAGSAPADGAAACGVAARSAANAPPASRRAANSQPCHCQPASGTMTHDAATATISGEEVCRGRSRGTRRSVIGLSGVRHVRFCRLYGC